MDLNLAEDKYCIYFPYILDPQILRSAKTELDAAKSLLNYITIENMYTTNINTDANMNISANTDTDTDTDVDIGMDTDINTDTNIDVSMDTDVDIGIDIDDILDNKLSVIKRFLRYSQSDGLTLLKYDNKIYALVINRFSYRPFEILPVISDLEHLQCFIAIDLNWHSLNEIDAYIKMDKLNSENNICIQNDNLIIMDLYMQNKERLSSIIPKTFSKLVTYYFDYIAHD